MNTQFAEDVLSLVTETPRVLNDIISSMRGGIFAQYDLPSKRAWRNVRDRDVEQVLEEYGAHFRYRRHGAGVAVYVATKPFSVIANPRARGPRELPVYSSNNEAFYAKSVQA